MPTVSTLTLQDMPTATAVPARAVRRTKSGRSRGSNGGVSTRRITQARECLPYVISDAEAIQLAILLQAQEKRVGFDMFESMKRHTEDRMEVDRLVAVGFK